MTDDQIRVDFEAHIAKLNAGKSGLNSLLERDYTGAYEKSWVQLGWLYWQAATLKATQWRDIATAPQDGKEICCWNPKELGIFRRVKWGHHLKNKSYTASWVTVTNNLSMSNLPTLWLPLPPTGTGVNHG